MLEEAQLIVWNQIAAPTRMVDGPGKGHFYKSFASSTFSRGDLASLAVSVEIENWIH